ncbi:superoxide dismutase [Microbispora sp. H10670]|uniref:superoxide dismutase n=1 Tax=Microbispora sp. H10670 TaxID=2729108 RepID=UPI0016005D96|nr:superoxide dismutase [Microbispora sp. H10670]
MTPPDPARLFEHGQQAAGVIAAKHRGDLAGAEALLAGFPDDQARLQGFCLLAELALSLVRAQTGQSMDDLVQELTLHMAGAALRPPPGTAAA